MQLTNYLNGSVLQTNGSMEGISTLKEKLTLIQLPFEKAKNSKKNGYIQFNLPEQTSTGKVKGFVYSDFTFLGILYPGTGEDLKELKGRYYYNDYGLLIKASWIIAPLSQIIVEFTSL